ncbi:MAG TPA: ATP-dependent DNA helicase [Candidatus Methanoperedens sp.]|nr:ATP-dependent DNA helicase [Candidatus Methanoperedens sp.]
MAINFDSEYKKLNPEQKLAVDTIEGPVMVIAGAGTGKTQTITLRIGKILSETQINPSNILCLTFTENAALNMRERLINIIGSPAYNVRISTFHGFCNSIIRDHPEYFLKSTLESEAIDDITQIEIIRSLIDKLPSKSPLKNLNFTYFYQKEIISSLSTLKKENISTTRFNELIKFAADFIVLALPLVDKLTAIRATAKASSEITTLITDLCNSPKINPLYRVRLQYFLNLYTSEICTLSELKKNIKDFIESLNNNLPKLRDLSNIYQSYQQTLQTRGFYDYEDMIIWVILALQTHSELLSQYQEIYQYLLVDEFQDSNSSQMEILNLLTRQQSNPNLFVVGDDDQSIYRFQGASIENVYTFYQKYQKNLKLIVLKNNYRSHQLILDSSQEVINHNQSRITQYIGNLDKSLKSVSTYDPDPINLFAANSPVEENYWVASKIKKLVDGGVTPSDIAILYRNNTDVNDLLPYLSQNNLHYLRSDAINILETLEIQQLLTLLKYLASPSDDTLLFHVLSFNFINLKPLNLYRLFHSISKSNLTLSEAIFDKEFLIKHKFSPKFIKKIKNFTLRITKVQKKSENLPADELFNYIIRKFNYLPYILKIGNLSLLKQLNTLYSHLKQSLATDKTDLFSWVKKLDLLFENNISLNSSALISEVEQSLRLMTVHKAKGLEFEHVFLIKVLSGKWDSSSNRSLIKLPLGILRYDLASSESLEEDRRLFYVALTRAKKQIYITYSRFNDSRREQLVSQFVSEINPKQIEKINSDSTIETNALTALFNPVTLTLQSLNLSSYLQNYLSTNYRFNITHLNSYLKCPLCFFFKTILRLPYPKTKSLSFGTSVHGALAYLSEIYKKENTLIPLSRFLSIFDLNLKRENLSKNDFQDLLYHGHQVLTDYYEYYKNDFNGRCLSEHDFKSLNVRMDDIPLTGKIDKIEFLTGNQVNVVDYKTGKPDSKYQELSPEGDYFRQLVFYKLLCSEAKAFPYEVVSGTIDFIEKNNKNMFVRKTYSLTEEDVIKLKSQIIEVFEKIKSLDFTPNSKCEDKDHLHYLFDRYFK